MKIEYLENFKFANKKFVDITDNNSIDDLKISIGNVTFDEEGKTSTIQEPDLRYYWDGTQLGLHISNIKFTSSESNKLLRAV